MIREQNISVRYSDTLGPSESKTGSYEDICFFNLSCSACPECDPGTTESYCYLEKTISPSQNYKRQTGACNVSVTCGDCTEKECDEYIEDTVFNYSVAFEVRIEKNFDNLSLVFMREDKPYLFRKNLPLGMDTFSASIDEYFECPVINTSVWRNYTFEQCNKYFPLMSTFDTQMNVFEHYTSSLLLMQGQTYNVTNELISCQLQLKNRLGEKESIQGDYQTCSAQLDAERELLVAEREKSESCEKRCEGEKRGLETQIQDIQTEIKIDEKVQKPFNITKNLMIGGMFVYSIIITIMLIKIFIK